MFRKILPVLAVLFLISGCADQTKEELLKEGLGHLRGNNPRGAVVLFKTALEKDPNFFEARFELARAYYAMGKYGPAEKELKKVIRQNPSLREAHVELARVYLQNSKPDDALDEIAGLIGEGNANALEIAGLAYAIKGEYLSASEFLEKSTAGGDKTAGIALARVYMKMGRTAEARSQISEVMKEEPGRDALYVLAELQADENDTVAAIKTYGRIINDHPSDIEAAYRKGVLHIQAGQYEEALSIADGLIRSFSKRPEGHRLKGMALLYGKDLDDAIVALQKSLAIRPDPGAYYFLGLCHYYEREPEQAITQLYRAIDLNPSFVQARVLASLILLERKRVDDAIAEVKRALEIDERNAFAHNVLGSAYMAKGMYEEGLQELNRAVEIDPALVDAHVKKGLFSLSRGKLEDAETQLKAAVKVAPDVLNSRVILASYYIRNEDYEKAINFLKDGIKGRREDAVIYNLIADASLRQNKVAEAVKYLQNAKKSDPDYYASYFNLAALHFLKGEHDRGMLELKSVVEKSPHNLKALLSLAAILETEGRDKEALRYYDHAVETGKTEAYIALAQYYLRKKEPDKSLTVLERATEKNPAQTSPLELRGRILLSQKKYRDAIKMFEDIGRINPELGLAYTVRAYVSMNKPGKAIDRVRKELRKSPGSLDLMAEISRLYAIMGNKQKAVENAERIIKRNPDSPVGYMVLAAVYRGGKEIDKAVATLEKASKLTDKNINLRMMLGNLYTLKREHASALDAYRKAEEIKSHYIPAIFQQGAVLHAMGKGREAADAYLRVLRLSFNHVPALNNLAYLYAEGNRDMDKALQLATRAYVLAPGDGAVNDTLGFVLLKSGKTANALEVLKRAVELLPDNSSVHYHLALAYEASGDETGAVENLEAALELGAFPEEGDAKTLLGQLKRE